MHASSLENMRKCFRRYVSGGELEALDRVVVLDIGGADVNGSYRSIFAEDRFHYISADLTDGPGVSLVLNDPYRLPLDDASVDIVLSGQMLEHCEFFWLAFAEMIRVLKRGGYLFLIAPSGGKEHRYPVDCYRFYPDAYRALAKYANCQLLDVWRDERGPWFDLVGVFARHGLPPAAPASPEHDLSEPQFESGTGSPEEEAVPRSRSSREALADIHRLLMPASYLEIGVRHGGSLALAHCPAVGVDPKPDLKVELPATTRVLPVTSDEFFDGGGSETLSCPPELVLIDGLHLFEYALRDFMNVERIASPNALVVIDDIFPNHPAQGARQRRTRIWAGDVWKLVACLKQHRPDLFLLPLDTSYTGLLLIAGLDSSNRVLWNGYNSIVRSLAEEAQPPEAILKREGAVAANEEQLLPILSILRDARAAPPARANLLKSLRAAAARVLSPEGVS
jgi:hypothetical protein